MKYPARQAADSFIVRMGDVGSALVVFVLADTLKLGAFAGLNLVLIAVWIHLVRESRKRTKSWWRSGIWRDRRRA